MIADWVFPLACCIAAAALEGAFAGPNVRRQLQEIRMPRYSPPFWGWIAIGLWYYATAFFVLHRLVLQPGVAGLTATALMGCILVLNAVWNLFFFRRRDFRGALVVSVSYSVLAVGLSAMLWLVDTTAAMIFVPYVVYLVYANVFGYRVWQLNIR